VIGDVFILASELKKPRNRESLEAKSAFGVSFSGGGFAIFTILIAFLDER
jgi:hypothetical protein